MNNIDYDNPRISPNSARRTLAALLLSITLLAITACSSGGDDDASGGDITPEATRPCGQETPCPPITLESPKVWPDGDLAASISLPNVWETGDDYVLEEFFISGHANVFNYNQAEAELGEIPGDNLVIRDRDMAYKTRILVAHPEQKEHFNGVVIIEFLHSGAGYDNATNWRPSSKFFRREGVVYIGVTASGDQSVAYLKAGCGGALPGCGERYAELSLDNNGLEYEIVSQLASALKSGDPDQSPLPADYNPVELVFITAFSLQTGSVITMANQFHQDAINGYFPQGLAGGRAIAGSVDSVLGVTASQFCGQPDAAPYPDCIGSLATGEAQLRTNLPVPVYLGMTEHDVVYNGGFTNRQPDADVSPYASFRLLEVPGAGHFASALGAQEIAPGYRRADVCVNQPGFRDTPVSAVDAFNAYWKAMMLQVREGRIPPNAPRIETDELGNILRDARGNALGGLRQPEFQFARASYFLPYNLAKPACTDANTENCLPFENANILLAIGNCFNLHSVRPFTSEELAELYPDRDRYVAEYTEYTRQLVSQGFLLEEDAQNRLQELIHGAP